MTTKTMTPAAGFAMSGVEGIGRPVSPYGISGVAAVTIGGWRRVQAPTSGSELSTAIATPIARNKANALPATHAVPAVPATPGVKPAALPLVTTLHVVTTKGAGRGNKGSSPWRFPV